MSGEFADHSWLVQWKIRCHGDDEGYYDTQTDTHETIKWEDVEEKARERIHMFVDKSFDSIEQCRNEYFTEGEVYYDTQTETHGAIEWEIMKESIDNNNEILEISTKPNESKVLLTKK